MAPVVGKSERAKDEASTEIEYVDRGLNNFQEIGHVCKFCL